MTTYRALAIFILLALLSPPVLASAQGRHLFTGLNNGGPDFGLDAGIVRFF